MEGNGTVPEDLIGYEKKLGTSKTLTCTPSGAIFD